MSTNPTEAAGLNYFFLEQIYMNQRNIGSLVHKQIKDICRQGGGFDFTGSLNRMSLVAHIGKKSFVYEVTGITPTAKLVCRPCNGEEGGNKTFSVESDKIEFDLYTLVCNMLGKRATYPEFTGIRSILN